jgi:DNA-binding NtrC family response regulator
MVATVEVPPLRRRADDVPVLARTFLRQFCQENGLAVKDLAPETVQLLVRHDWPGNVRELKNLLESLVVTVPDRVLLPEHLPEFLRAAAVAPAGARGAASRPASASRVGMTLAEAERELIQETLEALAGNRSRAARTLGIGLRTLQRKIREYGIDVPPRNERRPAAMTEA